MRRIFLVVNIDYFFGDILDRKLLLKEFPANESVFRLLKRDTFVEILPPVIFSDSKIHTHSL